MFKLLNVCVCAVRNAVWLERGRNVLIPADSFISYVSSCRQFSDLFHPEILHYCPSILEECKMENFVSWKSWSEWLWKPLRPLQQQEFHEIAPVWHQHVASPICIGYICTLHHCCCFCLTLTVEVQICKSIEFTVRCHFCSQTFSNNFLLACFL